MKNPFVFGVILLAASPFLNGCGSNNGSPADTSTAPQVVTDQAGNPLPNVDGTWASPCNLETVDDAHRRTPGGPRLYERDVYEIHGNVVTYDVQNYADAQCAGPASVASHYAGHYQSLSADNREPGARQVNLKFDTCSGDCSQFHGLQSNNQFANQPRVFKVDGGKFSAGVQGSNGSVQWDAAAGFTKIGN